MARIFLCLLIFFSSTVHAELGRKKFEAAVQEFESFVPFKPQNPSQSQLRSEYQKDIADFAQQFPGVNSQQLEESLGAYLKAREVMIGLFDSAAKQLVLALKAARETKRENVGPIYKSCLEMQDQALVAYKAGYQGETSVFGDDEGRWGASPLLLLREEVSGDLELVSELCESINPN